MRRPAYIRRRREIYVGCEGQSEQGYVRRLGQLADEAGLAVALSADVLLGAGDPLSRVELAARKLERPKADFARRFILLDDDQAIADPARADQARAAALRNGIELVWQSPCHEALLLRHLAGRAASRPPTSRDAARALQADWANYAKPMSALHLAHRIDLQGVTRAARVEPSLAVLLAAIGFQL